jgi:hypothetical protein
MKALSSRSRRAFRDVFLSDFRGMIAVGLAVKRSSLDDTIGIIYIISHLTSVKFSKLGYSESGVGITHETSD